jgi:hypothetical protein
MEMSFDLIRKILAGAPFEWAVAGGWAADLFAGRETRPHADLDIALWRQDQHLLRAHLKDGGEWFYAANGHLHPWEDGADLKPPVHEIHFLSGSPCEFLLNDRAGDNWQYRRNDKVLRDKNAAILERNGVKLLAPEIVLLYKSKEPRAEDESDFETLRPLMSEEQAGWLRSSLRACEPYGHPWLARL